MPRVMTRLPAAAVCVGARGGLRTRADKLVEEAAELFSECMRVDVDREAAAEELCDCVVTLCGIAHDMGLTQDEMERAMVRVTEKNEARGYV